MGRGRQERDLGVGVMYLLVAVVYLTSIATVPRHEGDEATWITTSAYLEDYVGGRFDAERWERSLWVAGGAPLTGYIIGIGRRLGGYGADDLNRRWLYANSVEQNDQEGRRPSDRLLFWARLPMAILAVASVCLAHRVVLASAGPGAGYLWLVLCIASAYLRTQLLRAMCESPLLFCVTAALLLTCRALARAKQGAGMTARGILLVAVTFGLVAGLAGSAKLNGLALLGAGMVLVGLLVRRLPASLPLRILFACCTIVILLAAAAIPFVALNPYYWPAPLDRALSMGPLRQRLMAQQMRALPEDAITSLRQRLLLVPQRVLQDYAAISDPLGGHTVIWFNGVLALLGLGLLVGRALGLGPGRSWDPAALAMGVVGFWVACPPLFTPLDWDRYYMLPVFFSTMVIAVALGWIIGQRRTAR